MSTTATLNDAQRHAMREALDGRLPLRDVLDAEVNCGELTPEQAAEVAEALQAGAGERWRS